MKLQKWKNIWVVLKDDVVLFESESFEIAHNVAYGKIEAYI